MTVDQALRSGERVWFGPRLVALFIDYVIIGIVWTVCGLSIMARLLPSAMLTPPIAGQNVPWETGKIPPEAISILQAMFWLIVGANILIFAYFVLMETWRGATLGKGFTGIATIDLAYPERRGLPIAKALIRELVKIAGFLPILIIGLVLFRMAVSQQAVNVANGQMQPFWVFPLELVLQVLPLAWIAWIGVSLVNNRDPIYDRVTGTAVVRTNA